MTVDELIDAYFAWEESHPRSERSWEYDQDEQPPAAEVGPTMCPYCGLEWLYDDEMIEYEPFGLSIRGLGVDEEPYVHWRACCLDAQAEVNRIPMRLDADDPARETTGFEWFYGVTLEDALSYLTGEDVVEVSNALDWAISRRLTIYDPTEVGAELEVEVKLWAGDRPASDPFWLPASATTRYAGEEAELGDWKPGALVEVLTHDGWVAVRVLHGAHYAAVSPPGWRDAAFSLVAQHHRRLDAGVGYKFAVACFNGPVDGGKLVGVAIVSRPIAQATQTAQPGTLEVTRVATWGDLKRNASSKLYAACGERARELGYDRLITATHADESGESLRSAGWQVIGIRRRVDLAGHGRSGRVRSAPKDPIGKTRWAMGLTQTQKRAVRRAASEFAARDQASMAGLFQREPNLAELAAWIALPNRLEADAETWLAAQAALAAYVADHPEPESDVAYMKLVAKLRGVSVEELKHLATSAPPPARPRPMTSEEWVDRWMEQEEELLAWDEAELAALRALDADQAAEIDAELLRGLLVAQLIEPAPGGYTLTTTGKFDLED
jgi:hypothetical protein